MKYVTRASLVAMLLAATTGTCFAQQQIFINGRQPRTKPVRKQLETQIQTAIGDISRACKLSDAQVRKLEVAGKGAVASALEKHKQEQKKMQQRMRGMGLPVPPGAVEAEADADAEEEDDDDEEEDEAEDEFTEIAVAGAAINLAVFGGLTTQPTVTEEPRWKKALSTVLTKDQQAQYKTAVAKRDAYRQKMAVGSFIAKVDQKLLLSPEQREKLEQAVDAKYGKQLAAQFARQFGNHNVGFLAGTVVRRLGGGQSRQAVPHKELGEFLSDSQIDEWKSRFEQELLNLPPVGRPGGLGGLGGILPQAGAIRFNVRQAAPVVIEAGQEDPPQEDR